MHVKLVFYDQLKQNCYMRMPSQVPKNSFQNPFNDFISILIEVGDFMYS